MSDTFTTCVNNATFIPTGGGDGDELQAEKATKQVTAVQVCVSAFVSVTPPDIF